MRHLRLIFALAFVACGTARAQTWIYYGTDVSGTAYYYDSDTLNRTGDVIRVWVRQDHSRDRTIAHRESKLHWELDCGARTRILLGFADYDANGAVLASETVPSYRREQHDAVPGSIGETLLETVCA